MIRLESTGQFTARVSKANQYAEEWGAMALIASGRGQMPVLRG